MAILKYQNSNLDYDTLMNKYKKQINKNYTDLLRPKSKPTDFLWGSSNTSGQLAIESYNYCKKMNKPIKSVLTDINKVNDLTNNEKKVLTYFMNNKNQLVTFEEIGDIIWDNKQTDKYSLHAISKLISRVRKKISKTGISQQLIHTEKGKGYVLYD